MEEELFDFWVEETKKTGSGWAFSYFKDRLVTAPLDWSYTSEIIYPLRQVDRLLDINTRGGEFLSQLQPLPATTVATEDPPNLELAMRNLEPLGVKVVETTGMGKLPLKSNGFDLVLNRHGELNPEEIYRVLDENGYLITQQIGSADQKQLNQLLLRDDTQTEFWNKDIAVEQLENAGFEIIKALESKPLTKFFDIGALIFYLQKVSRQVDDFSVERFEKQLRSIHAIINQKGSIESLAHRFFISAVKS